MANRKQNESNPSGVIFDIIVYIMMIVAVVFIVLQTFLNQFVAVGFRIGLGAWILIAVGISDFVGPMMTHELDEYTPKRLKLFILAAILDAIAYMCLYVFIIFVGSFKEPTHYFYLAGALAMFGVRFLVNQTNRKLENADENDTHKDGRRRLMGTGAANTTTLDYKEPVAQIDPDWEPFKDDVVEDMPILFSDIEGTNQQEGEE